MKCTANVTRVKPSKTRHISRVIFLFFKRSPRQFCLGLRIGMGEECAERIAKTAYSYSGNVLEMVYFTEWVYCAVISREVWQRYKNKGREHYTTLICVLATWEGIVLCCDTVSWRVTVSLAAWLRFRRSVSLDALRSHGHAFLDIWYRRGIKNSNSTLWEF